MISINILNSNKGSLNQSSAVDVQGLFKALCRHQDISFKVFQDIFSEKRITSSVMAPIAASLKEKAWYHFNPYLKVFNSLISQFKAHYSEFDAKATLVSMDFLKPVFCQALDTDSPEQAWQVFADIMLIKKHFQKSFKISLCSSAAVATMNGFFKNLEALLDYSKKANLEKEKLVFEEPFFEFFKRMVFCMKERVGERWRTYQGEQVSSLCRNALFVDLITETTLDTSSVKSLILS